MNQELNGVNIINQDVLRQLESLCVEDEPPACSAACPLHVDVRAMLPLIAGGDWKGAFKLYQKAVPFAGIVASTCDAPCQGACKRLERGGAVNIALIEAAMTREAYAPAKAPFTVPQKPQRVAIIGGGLRGMAAADSLARKGYKPVIFEESGSLGGRLRELPENILPAAVLESETAALLKLPVEVEYSRRVEEDEAADMLSDGFSAVFFACESSYDDIINKDTLISETPGILAGKRGGRLTGGPSSVYDVLDGKSAALTIERIIQGVSVFAGREKEGSAATRLYVSLDGVEDSAPVPPGHDGYNAEEAISEASRCLDCRCLECVKKCAFMAHYKGYPRKLVREAYNNLSIAMGNHDANGMINTCALCGQCGEICPNGLDMSEVFLAARERMTATGKMPARTFEFALLDMDYSLSQKFFVARHQPGHEESRYLFFPGCQLAASEPVLLERVYSDLSEKLTGGVALMLGCCGVMAHWAGDGEKESAIKEKLLSEIKALGNPEIIAGCPTCAGTFRDLYGLEAKSVYELSEIERAGAGINRTMRLHHACGARHDKKQQEAVIRLIEKAGVKLLPGVNGSDLTSPCCGYGGLLSFADENIAGKMTALALSQISESQDEPVITYCVNCRDRYLAAGREAYHLLEFLYPDVEGLNHKSPSWSSRQENRAELKRRMLLKLWGEKTEEAVRIKLYIGEALEEKLEKDHILRSDIEEAVSNAQEDNARFFDKSTGRFTTSHRPGNVTFWVEYSPREDGFEIHNAYSHRMNFIVTEKLSQSGAGENG